ncbi:MAG: hypothetical protein J6W63_10935, partial [Treponema sp.]|nr:hypothetical protein [Treponema sp.]
KKNNIRLGCSAVSVVTGVVWVANLVWYLHTASKVLPVKAKPASEKDVQKAREKSLLIVPAVTDKASVKDNAAEKDKGAEKANASEKDKTEGKANSDSGSSKPLKEGGDASAAGGVKNGGD